MIRSQFGRMRLVAGIVAALSMLGASQALGAGFALQEQSASGMGNAFAGGAAAAEDASSMSVNPATLSKYASPQVVLGVHFITPSFKFHDDGSQPAAFQPLGSSGGDGGSTNVVPNIYLAVPINRDFTFGLGVNVPFGLVTEYDDDFLGRFQGIKSKVETINVNPALSWRVNDEFTLGVGVNWQHIKADFTSMVNYSGALAQAAQTAAAQGLISPDLVPTIIGATSGPQSKTTVDASDSAWGWNVGALWDLNPDTRIGIAYRAPIKYSASGNVNFDNPTPSVPPALAPVVGLLAQQVNAVALYDGGIHANIKLPDQAHLSIFQTLNDRWDWMADLQWTGWSTLKDLTFVRTTGPVLQSTPENFDDTWRFAVGANYKYNDQWKFRGGVAFDQTPVNDTDRTVRLPDGDRTWLSAGLRYSLTKQLKFDLGFSYIFIDRPSIDQNAGNAAQYGLVKGHYDADVVIVSGQMVYSF
jgi:long-chain fatty acid transport protein